MNLAKDESWFKLSVVLRWALSESGSVHDALSQEFPSSQAILWLALEKHKTWEQAEVTMNFPTLSFQYNPGWFISRK